MIPLYWLAGSILLLLAVSNVPVRSILPFRRDLAGVSPAVRQICTVHHHYIAGVILGMSALCVFFAPDLAAGGPLPTFLNAGMALFWGARLLLQLFTIDRSTRRSFRAWDALFTLAFLSLTTIFASAAAGGLR